MDGTLTIEGGTFDEFLHICCVNLASAESTLMFRIRQFIPSYVKQKASFRRRAMN